MKPNSHACVVKYFASVVGVVDCAATTIVKTLSGIHMLNIMYLEVWICLDDIVFAIRYETFIYTFIEC